MSVHDKDLQPVAAGVGAVPPAQAPSPAARAEVKRLAQEFESVLLTQILRDMRASMVDDQSSGSTFEAMTDTIDAEFARAMSAAGGFGLSGALVGALERLTASRVAVPAYTVPASSGAAEPVAPTPPDPGDDGTPTSAVVAAPLDAPPAANVTSAFGWRRDPLTGAQAFHSGIDIRMPSGEDVRAAAGGRVSFAGEDGGYGNMVAILHPDGRETRYAHLSAQFVHVGDRVEAGQVVGKSGRSGRTTGPHLHFEVRVNGRAVDPSVGL